MGGGVNPVPPPDSHSFPIKKPWLNASSPVTPVVLNVVLNMSRPALVSRLTVLECGCVGVAIMVVELGLDGCDMFGEVFMFVVRKGGKEFVGWRGKLLTPGFGDVW